jgi:hypothetical protein
MKPEDDTPSFSEVAGLWRDWLAKRTVPAPAPSLDEALAKLRAAKACADRRWLPPPVNVAGDLAAILTAWQPAWTRELRTHPAWRTEAARVREARALLESDRLSEAGYTIESILSECCRGARALLSGTGVRKLDDDRTPPSDAECRTGLDAVLRWLEELT